MIEEQPPNQFIFNLSAKQIRNKSTKRLEYTGLSSWYLVLKIHMNILIFVIR